MPTASSDAVTVWVVGAGGLLGRAVTAEAAQIPGRTVRTVSVPWHDRDAAATALAAAAKDVGRDGHDWRVLWCAGAAVTGTAPSAIDDELRALGTFLDHLPVRGEQTPPTHGALLLASSAGGTYAGSGSPPFSEHSPTRAISPYGAGKLRAEEAVRTFAARSGVPVVIGRLSNLYGPGQDVRKPQGLITQLCLAQLTRAPLSIYVSLDTIRDYLYVDDAAAMVVRAVDRAAAEPTGTVVVKILASHRPATLASILGEIRRVTRRRPHVTLGQSPMTSLQTRDLRLDSKVWTDLDTLAVTPIQVGIAATMADLRSSLDAAGARRA
jgi:UDP-glucose 4-epimerase